MERWGLRFSKIVPKVKAQDVVRKWKIFTGDIVRVLVGPEKGYEGKVECVLRKKNLVIVSGLNLAKVRIKRDTPDSVGYYLVEKGINVSNVALVDPKTNEPTKVFWQVNEQGEKVRVSRLSGVIMPKPLPPVVERKAGPFDTNPPDVLKKTFFSSLLLSPIPEDCISI